MCRCLMTLDAPHFSGILATRILKLQNLERLHLTIEIWLTDVSTHPRMGDISLLHDM